MRERYIASDRRRDSTKFAHPLRGRILAIRTDEI